MTEVYKPLTETGLGQFSDETDSDGIDNIKSFQAFVDEERIPTERLSICDFGDEGFLLKRVFSETECHHYTDQAELTGFDYIPEARKSYRNCARIMFKCEEMASELWKRIEPYLEDITIEGDPHQYHLHGIQALMQGTWRPHALNEAFRLIRYHPGGHFAPHFDGHFVVSHDVRSFKTCMLYLNRDFEGGTTNFVDESQILYMNEEGKYCAEEKNILHKIHPESGMAIIFNHHRLHEGEALRSGVKYILRTDILYKRVDGPAIDNKEREALALVQEAERLEALGENMQAMELYRKAFKMSPSVAESYGCP